MKSVPTSKARSETRSAPPGRIKIMGALKSLLEGKEFNAITTAEIAKTAGVTEGLIYKYFGDKRDLLHKVLAEYMEGYLSQAETDLKGIKGASNKLRKIIWGHINMYATNRVIAKILLVEVRNFPDYFKSDAYETVKRYNRILSKILEEGVEAGELRTDVSPSVMRRVALGAIEQAALPGVIFNAEIDTDSVAEELFEVIINGIRESEPRS